MFIKGYRGAAIITAMLVGLLIGLFAGAYIFSTWLATDSILQNASPKFLNYDAVNHTPQYRDFYIVRAASKYQHDLQSGIADPLRGAYDVLGITTGDTSIDEAIAMVRWTKDVANLENKGNGNLGQFTSDEEFSIGTLLSELERAKKEGTYPKPDTSVYGPTVARTNNRIVGGLILLLLIGAAGLLVWLVDRSPATLTPVSVLTNTPPSRVEPTFINVVSAAPASVDMGMTPMPTSASSADAGVVLQPPNIIAPAASGEVRLPPFAPTVYQHGDDTYDQGFNIIGPMGELLAECGVSIADRLGQENPAKVDALSLWVFDKADFNSTTKLIVTDFALNDAGIRAKLKGKGDITTANEGALVEIVTTSVRVEIRVTDVLLNQDAPANSYFQTAKFTFTAFQRPTGA
jgi:hypothetical protein